MQLDTFFRRLPPSPALHRYAHSRLQAWEKSWHRPLQLRLIFSQAGRQVQLELAGRDAAGHAISGRSLGADGFAAVDQLFRQMEPQGLLLASAVLDSRERQPRVGPPLI